MIVVRSPMAARVAAEVWIARADAEAPKEATSRNFVAGACTLA